MACELKAQLWMLGSTWKVREAWLSGVKTGITRATICFQRLLDLLSPPDPLSTVERVRERI